MARFFHWLDEHGLTLRQVRPVHVAAYIEQLGQAAETGGGGLSVSSMKQHLSALRMLGDFLVVMVYTFARISAVLALDVADYYQVGRRMMFRFSEKGGCHHEMPAHHTLVEYMDAFQAELQAEDGPLFQSLNRRRDGYTIRRLDRSEAWAMVKRRCKRAGLGERFSNHTFRATGITTYLENGGHLEQAQFMAAHASPRTTKLCDRRAQSASPDEVERIIL